MTHDASATDDDAPPSDPLLRRVHDLAQPLLALANTHHTILRVEFATNPDYTCGIRDFLEEGDTPTLSFGKNFIATSSDDALRGVIAHEIGHLLHPEMLKICLDLEREQLTVDSESHARESRMTAFRGAHIALCVCVGVGIPLAKDHIPPSWQPLAASVAAAVVATGVLEATLGEKYLAPSTDAAGMLDAAVAQARHSMEFRCDEISSVLVPTLLKESMREDARLDGEKDSPSRLDHPTWTARLANLEALEGPDGETRREALLQRYVRPAADKER